MDKKRMKLEFCTFFSEIKDLNPNFAYGKMRIAYAGRNRNYSDISKEVFEAAIPTMYNCPIVARYDRENDEFGSHDIEVVVKDGKIKVVNATAPLGIVPSGADWCWETVEEEDGVQREYLITDVLLWKRQEAYEHLREVGYVDQSMECDFIKYHMDEDDYCVADEICFSAFCLLQSAEPCFESAGVQVFNEKFNKMFKQQFNQMIEELKDCTKQQNLNFNINSKKEGSEILAFDEALRDSILAEFKMSLDEINFEITEDMTEEVFRNKIKEISEAKNSESNSKKTNYEKEVELFATYNQKRDAIREILDPVIIENNNEIVSEICYWLCDFDDTYAFVERETYSEGSFKIDHGRFKYTYNEDEDAAQITSEFELMVPTWLTVEEKQKLEESRKMFDKLVAFKNERLKEDHENKINEVLTEFEDIFETEDFAKLLENVYEIEDIEDVKTKCYAIRGKMSQVKFKKKDSKDTPKVPIGKSVESEPYGGLFSMYSNK